MLLEYRLSSMNTSSDFKQWLHAMKLVARLPGGTPPEFRRKLWLALADRHLHTSGIDWNKEQTKCLSDDTWLDDDEELGIQIVKDLHRTGSSLFTGPNGSINQAKLKRVLLGYARWNPEVGYCQGFNMLGALILQVMDKSEIEALKVMIYLVEGILPKGYFSGSLGGLQADMAVFREIMSTRLPKLSKHLQRLQGATGESSFEPPLTNVFTMQWFLTLFCTCLPKNCVLRVWDLVLIEGSDILLRTALAIWEILEERILVVRTADEFYCKMGTLSGELLNGHLFDSNGLIQKVVDLGPIPELQKMREKHLYNITPWKDRQSMRVFYSDDDGDSDEDSWRFMANARRGSLGLSLKNRPQQPLNEARDRIALDISLLKKQYAKLRERQKQAHIILSNAARQTVNPGLSNAPQINVSQYLVGRNAIVSSKGRRIGPPAGSIPPARTSTDTTTVPPSKQIKPTAKLSKRARADSGEKPNDHEKHSKIVANNGNETAGYTLQKSHSTTSSISSMSSTSDVASKLPRFRKESSSSYSEDDSEHEMVADDFDDHSSSTSTSLCDDETNYSSSEASPLKKKAQPLVTIERLNSIETVGIEAKPDAEINKTPQKDTGGLNIVSLDREMSNDTNSAKETIITHENDSNTEINVEYIDRDKAPTIEISTSSYDTHLNYNEKELLAEALSLPQQITSTSQLSPIEYLSFTCISPLKSPESLLYLGFDNTSSFNIDYDEHQDSGTAPFKVNEDGVTNKYFERINQGTVNSSSFKLETDISAPYSSQESATPVTTVPNSYSNTKKDVENVKEMSLHAFDACPQSPTNVSSNLEGGYSTESNICTDTVLEYQIESQSEYSKITEFSTESQARQKLESEENTKIDNDTLSTYEPPPKESIDFDDSSDVSNVDSAKNTDRILKIIEENSKILHRIMNKNVASNEAETAETMRSVDESDCQMNSSLPKLSEHAKSEENFTTESSQKDLFVSQVETNPSSSNWKDFVVPNVLSSNILAASDGDILITMNSADTDSRDLELNLNKCYSSSNFDSFKSDDMNDRDEILSIEKSILNDSPMSIDHIINSDSDYTVRNVSACSDIIDKEDTVREIDEYLLGIVKPLPVQDDMVKEDDDSTREKILDALDMSPIYRYEDNINIHDSCAKPEGSRFSKYIDDVATGVISDNCETLSDFDTYSVNTAEAKNPPSWMIDSKPRDLHYLNDTYIEDTIRNDIPETSSSNVLNNDQEVNIDDATMDSVNASSQDDDRLTDEACANISSLLKSDEFKAPDSIIETSSVYVRPDEINLNNGDISATLSSIQNTIMSIDFLCKDDQRRSRSRTDKTLDEIIKVVEQMDANRINENTRLRSRPVSLIIEDTSMYESKSIPFVESSERKERYLSMPRYSRDRWRDHSPRRRVKEDDFVEYESRVRRETLDPSDTEVCSRRAGSSDTYKIEELPKALSPCVSSSKYGSSEKFEIRHTTVTSTFYDRFLSQKKERQNRMDKSPSSPVITKAYLDSLKPECRGTDGSADRNSRSAENSPNRTKNVYSYESSLTQSVGKPSIKNDLLYPQYPVLSRFSQQTQSCDNIPSRLSHKRNF